MGDLLQCAALGRFGQRGGRVRHPGRIRRPAPDRPGRRLRRTRARRDDQDPVPHRSASQSQLRSLGSLHRVRRREGRGRPVERLRRGSVRALAARGHARDPVRARLRDPRHPRERAASGVPDPGAGDQGKGGGPPLRLEVGPVEGQSSPEAYELVIDPTAGVRIGGVSSAGIFYGLQSLRSLFPPPSPRGGLVLPAIRIVDAPRFGYRGFMLDVARNFHPKAAVLRTLDLLARYKLNVFHIHLTYDEGWRVEIPSLPELTAVGARRGHTLDSRRFLQPAFGSGPQVDQPWGSGFFSHADYVEIVRYATARHIEIIPEIEMPGHARAATMAMAGNQQYRLTDPEDRSVYTSVQGYPDNVMNPALESTYGFIERVVSDLAAMHREAGAPLRHIHMGGDEVPAGVWVGSPAVQAYMQAHGLTSVDDLWFVFYGRVEQILKAQGGGLLPSGWEEIAVRKTQRDGQG